jgi:hypothetical protein
MILSRVASYDPAMLPSDPAAPIARAGVDPTRADRALEDALQSVIASRRGYRWDWWVGEDSLWHVELLWPERETFGGRTLAEALAWCLVRMMGWTGEIGIEGFPS